MANDDPEQDSHQSGMAANQIGQDDIGAAPAGLATQQLIGCEDRRAGLPQTGHGDRNIGRPGRGSLEEAIEHSLELLCEEIHALHKALVAGEPHKEGAYGTQRNPNVNAAAVQADIQDFEVGAERFSDLCPDLVFQPLMSLGRKTVQETVDVSVWVSLRGQNQD
jgi:hypothetical protein